MGYLHMLYLYIKLSNLAQYVPYSDTLNDDFTTDGTYRAGACYHLKHIASLPFSVEVSVISFRCQFCCNML